MNIDTHQMGALWTFQQTWYDESRVRGTASSQEIPAHVQRLRLTGLVVGKEPPFGCEKGCNRMRKTDGGALTFKHTFDTIILTSQCNM